MTLHERFRTKLQQALRERGWSQSELARKMGVAQPTVGDYYHGRTCPGLDMVAKFESALEIVPGSLVDDQPLRLVIRDSETLPEKCNPIGLT